MLRILICIIPSMNIFKVQRNTNIKTSDTDNCDKLLDEKPKNETTYDYDTEEDDEDIRILVNRCMYSTK